MRQKSGVTDLMIAAWLGNKLEVLKYLEQAGKQALYGETAFVFAAINDNVECGELLAPSEASIRDQNGLSAVDYAKALKSINFVRAFEGVEQHVKNTNESVAKKAAQPDP